MTQKNNNKKKDSHFDERSDVADLFRKFEPFDLRLGGVIALITSAILHVPSDSWHAE
jgi:hypothetical protein